ncbi:MAG: hypothetical protein II322_01355, partial [Alistipes sp.]|nr:hypothetical protein [Alistipes sp.]
MTEIKNNDIVEALRRETQQLIDEMLEREEAEKQTFRKYLVNGFDMLQTTTEKMDYLMAPLLPRVGMAALVGS